MTGKPKRILFSLAYLKQDSNGLLDLTADADLETVFHELAHCEQARRGFWERLKMRWSNLVKSHGNRPHEREAKAMAQAWVREFRAR